MMIGYGLMIWFCGPVYQIAGYGLKENFSLPISVAGFLLLIIGIFQKNKVKIKFFGSALLGLLYISLCFGLIMDLFSVEVIRLHDTSLIVANPYFYAVSIIASLWLMILWRT